MPESEGTSDSPTLSGGSVRHDPSYDIFPFAVPNPLPIAFVLTTLRHGSSLFSFVLNAHPMLYALQGLYLLNFASLAERREKLPSNPLFLEDGFATTVADLWGVAVPEAEALIDEWTDKNVPIQLVYHMMQQRCAPRLFVDRGTVYGNRFIIRRLAAMFEHSFFIHLHRHPYDVLRSGAKLLGDTLRFRGVDVDEASLALGVASEYAHVHEEVLSW